MAAAELGCTCTQHVRARSHCELQSEPVRESRTVQWLCFRLRPHVRCDQLRYRRQMQKERPCTGYRVPVRAGWPDGANGGRCSHAVQRHCVSVCEHCTELRTAAQSCLLAGLRHVPQVPQPAVLQLRAAPQQGQQAAVGERQVR